MENIVVLDIGDQNTLVTRFCVENGERLMVEEQKRIPNPPGESVLGPIIAGFTAGSQDIQEIAKCYVLIPSRFPGDDDNVVLEEVEDGLRVHQEQLRLPGTVLPQALLIGDRSQALRNICDMVRRETGKVLVLEVRTRAVTVAGNISGEFALTEFLTSSQDVEFDLKTAAGIVKTTGQVVSAAISALERHLAQIGCVLLPHTGGNTPGGGGRWAEKHVEVDWIIAAGEPLVELPNDLQVLENGLRDLINQKFNRSQSLRKVPILIDRSGIIPAIGALIPEYPAGSWSLLMESLSIDS